MRNRLFSLSVHQLVSWSVGRLVGWSVCRVAGLWVCWISLLVVVGCQTSKTPTKRDLGTEVAAVVADGTAPTDLATNAALVKAGLYCGLGSRGANFVYWGKILKDSPDVELTYLDGEDLRNGMLDGLDILVMPGGSSKKQYGSMQEEGAKAIRRFIRGGGKYFGTCAGLSLLLEETNRVALLPPHRRLLRPRRGRRQGRVQRKMDGKTRHHERELVHPLP